MGISKRTAISLIRSGGTSIHRTAATDAPGETVHTNSDFGKSGTAGSIDLFPSTASMGKLRLTAADSSGDTTTAIVNASQAAARTYTIPDAGANASFILSTSTVALSFSGAFTDDVIDFSSATIAPTGSNGPCMIRAGTYASPIDLSTDVDQSGVIRIYTTCSATGTSYDRGLFACTRTTNTKGAFPIAGLAEANNSTGTGPNKVQAGQFIAHLGAGGEAAKLATLGGDATAGMYGVWAKVTAGGTCTASSGSRVAPIWVDNQMSGTVSGEEYGIFATTGASRVDAFIGFNTTSSGYNQFINCDSTFNSGAGTCFNTNAVPGTQDARINVYYDGAQYYLALYR